MSDKPELFPGNRLSFLKRALVYNEVDSLFSSTEQLREQGRPLEKGKGEQP